MFATFSCDSLFHNTMFLEPIHGGYQTTTTNGILKIKVDLCLSMTLLCCYSCCQADAFSFYALCMIFYFVSYLPIAGTFLFFLLRDKEQDLDPIA